MLQIFFRKKRFLLLLLLFILIAYLFTKDIDKRTPYNILDKIILGLLVPPLKITNLCITKASQTWDDYFFLVNLKKDNAFLKEYIQKLEIENQLLREKAIENTRLRKLLSFKKNLSYHILPSEIIGRDPSSWFKSIIIDKGSTAGVSAGCGVITPNGIVGKIISVSASSSKVLLISDVNSAVDVLIKRSRKRGILEGYGENSCRLSYVLKNEDIKKDDIIVTSGINNIYPKGLLVGSVAALHNNKSGFFQFVEIKPTVDFSKLNEVLIVLKQKAL